MFKKLYAWLNDYCLKHQCWYTYRWGNGHCEKCALERRSAETERRTRLEKYFKGA